MVDRIARGGAGRPRVIQIIEFGLLALLLALPFLIGHFLTIIATRMLILAIFAISFDLCWGYSGIMSFGQAVFFGMAGYVVALVANNAGFVQLWGVIPIAMLVGLVMGFSIGWFLLLGKRTPTIIYVALGTLTASFAAERLVAGWQWVGGANGLSIWNSLMVGGYELEPGLGFYYVAAGFLLSLYLVCRYLVRSQFGLVLAGMRQNERRLAFLGYKVQVFKFLVFAFAGMISAISGALYSYHEGFVGPSNLGIVQSTYAVLYTLFGGAGTLIGPVIGTIAMESISFFLAGREEVKTFWPVILGLIMLLVVVWKPAGLLGFMISARERSVPFGYAGRPPHNGGDAPSVREERRGDP